MKTLSHGIINKYMQDTGSITTKPCTGCTSTKMPTGKPWSPFIICHGIHPKPFPQAVTRIGMEATHQMLTTILPTLQTAERDAQVPIAVPE